jgi:hypothetical protein
MPTARTSDQERIAIVYVLNSFIETNDAQFEMLLLAGFDCHQCVVLGQ